MSWVATEYYSFMSLVPRPPSFIDTVIHFIQGAAQLACAFLVTTPYFFVCAVAIMGITGIFSYSNNIVLTLISLPSGGIRNKVLWNLGLGFVLLVIDLFIVLCILHKIGFWAPHPVDAGDALIKKCLFIVTCVIWASVMIIGWRTNRTMRVAWETN